jgi:hypothetical protein
VGIGKKCAGMGCDDREEQVLASNALVQDAMIGRSGYWDAMGHAMYWIISATS